MMDAISFVLGVQSRHLRSNHLKELVFRKDADSAPARRASVKLFYEVSEDEIDGYLGGTEISFCRSISAAGVSSYKLNNRDVTYERYEETLQQIGVLVKARNFLVFQGDVEAVASKSPQDLTKLLKQISGSDQYALEYEDLLRRKGEAEENTIFSMQKKKMYTTQCREVKGQKDEAEYYQDKLEELNEKKTEYVLWQIWCVKAEMEGKQDQADALREQLDVIKSSEAAVEEEMGDGKRDYAKESKALNAAEKTAGGINKQLEGITPKLTEARAKLKSVHRRRQDLDKKRKKVETDLAQQRLKMSGLEGDILALTEVEEELKAELEAEQQPSNSGGGGGGGQLHQQLDAAGLAEYTRLREEVSARIAAERADERTLTLDLKSKQEHQQRLQAQQESQLREEATGEKLMAECEARRQLLASAIQSCQQEQASCLQTRETLVQDATRIDAQLRVHRAELEQLQEKLREVGDARRRGKQEERMAEALSSMQRIFKGVHGRLADLCRPIQRKYSQAVSVAAGKHMEAVVVENKAVAQECIRYLKDQRVGTCTFLPLDNLTSKPLPERLRTFGRTYRPCVDLLECDEQYKVAVAYAVGATLVCDSLEEARELCFVKGERVKVVTLRGHSISKSGAMTGGAAAGGQDGQQDRWGEREADGWRARRGELEQMVAQLTQQAPTRQQMLEVEMQLRACQSKLRLNDTDLTVAVDKVAHLQQQKELRAEQQQRLHLEARDLAGEVKSLERRLASVHGRITQVEAEVFAEFSAQRGIENIREYEEKALKRHQELVQKHAAVVKQSAALAAELSYEQKRNYQGTLDRLDDQARDAEEEQQTLEDTEQALLEEELEIRAKLRAANEKVKGVQQQKEELRLNMQAVQARKAEVLKDRERVAKQLAGEEILIERGRTQLHDILQKARVDEIALPTVQSNVSSGGHGEGDAGEEEGEEEMEESENSSGSNNSTSKRSSSRSSSSYRDSEDLAWEGTQTVNNNSNIAAASDDQADSEDNDSSGRSSSGHSGTTGSGTGTGTSKTGASTHFSQRDNPTVLKDSRTVSLVDLSAMRRKHKNLTKNRMEEVDRSLQADIKELHTELESIQPNMHAAERYEGVVDKLRACNMDLDDTKEAARSLNVRFEEVRQLRQSAFGECFAHVSEALGTIYRDLTRSGKHPLGGNAYLTLDNTEEPYLGGIRFTAMPPMKRFRDMDQLSGGEKTMAALALLFSVHSFRQAPFFVLDEVDAALDNVNVKKICNYIQQRSRDFQCVVISLKDMFFEHADCLVGICKDVDSLSSEVLTLDLSRYPDHQAQQELPEGEATTSSSPAAITAAAGGSGSSSKGSRSSGGGSSVGSGGAGRKRKGAGGLTISAGIAEEEEEEEQE